jgi:hypothetical protein
MNDHDAITPEDVRSMTEDDICPSCVCVSNLENIKELYIEIGEIEGEEIVLAVLCNRCRTIYESLLPYFDEELFTTIPEAWVSMIILYYINYFKEKDEDPEEHIFIRFHDDSSAEEVAEEVNEFGAYLESERKRLEENGED